jgi:hypothetical protein
MRKIQWWQASLPVFGLVCTACFVPAVYAHPDSNRQALPGAKLKSSNQTETVQADADRKQLPQAVPDCAGAPSNPDKALSPSMPQPPKRIPIGPWFHDYRNKPEYRTALKALVAEAAHKHWCGDDKLLIPPPVEIWYLATRKTLADGRVAYCVAPRIENPAARIWTTSFEVRLFSRELTPRGPVFTHIDTASVTPPVPAESSLELVVSSRWCLKQAPGLPKPNLVIDTDHGSAVVEFPGP